MLDLDNAGSFSNTPSQLIELRVVQHYPFAEELRGVRRLVSTLTLVLVAFLVFLGFILT